MTTTDTIKHNTTLASVLHLSTFSQFFIPLGNFIFPTLLWLSRRNDPFVDHHGRNALNFQISLFLYSVFIIAVGVASLVYFGLKKEFLEPFLRDDHFVVNSLGDAMPFIVTFGIFGIILLGLFVLQLFAVINASIKASEGKPYNYPLTINFIASAEAEDTNHQNQSKNEQSNSSQNQTL